MSLSTLKLWVRKLGIKEPNSLQPTREKSISSSPTSISSNLSEYSQTKALREYLSRRGISLLPQSQQQLLVLVPKEPFHLEEDAPVPTTEGEHETLIRIDSIGLNPIDWKSPTFGFGLPSLPCVLGRDFVGTVVKIPNINQKSADFASPSNSRLRPGDVVLGISTDYRDYRKAAFQQYAVASDFNLCRLPPRMEVVSSILPSIGVAFVAAALSLGVCLGLDFHAVTDTPGPDIYRIVHTLSKDRLPEDIRSECLDRLPMNERIQREDWLAVWGASSTVGFFTVQLAKRAGLKVVAIADLTKHGSKLLEVGADLLVHRANPEEAVTIVRSVMEGKNLRYGVDTVGKETAQLLQSTFGSRPVEHTTLEEEQPQRHLVCLVASPKAATEGRPQTTYHKLPVKLFHEAPEVGHALVTWLEDLLFSERGLVLPKVDVHPSKGLRSVCGALDRLRDGEFSAQRIVVEL